MGRPGLREDDPGRYVTVWVIGDNLRVRRAYTAELEACAARLEHERESDARIALATERGRIARELHDAVAHSVSVMVVQAGAARRVVETRPEQATDALRAIEGPAVRHSASCDGSSASCAPRTMSGWPRSQGSPSSRRS